MLYTDCQSGRNAAIARHVSFAQITCLLACSTYGLMRFKIYYGTLAIKFIKVVFFCVLVSMSSISILGKAFVKYLLQQSDINKINMNGSFDSCDFTVYSQSKNFSFLLLYTLAENIVKGLSFELWTEFIFYNIIFYCFFI